MKFLRKKWKKTLLLISLLKFIFYPKKKLDRITHFFFFPFYHMGGAEKVHADILNTLQKEKICVFMTNPSADKSFYEAFKKTTPYFFEIGSVHYNKVYKKPLLRMISKIINRQNKAIVFTCNSAFGYEIMPLLNAPIKCIDLIHAMVHKGENGPEYWSLPVIDKLSKRVFISKYAIKQLEELYIEQNIPTDELKKVFYIPNKTIIGEKKSNSSRNKELTILYVGRGSYEKRLQLIGRIAKECRKQSIPTIFNLIGDVKDYVPQEYHSEVNFVGQINNYDSLSNYYQKSDIILITSSREGFPMVIMEGMAWGVLPISTSVGDISNHITNKQNGYLIESLDEDYIVTQFTEAIKQLHNDRSLLSSLSDNAYDYSKANFSDAQFAKKYHELFEVSSTY